MEFKLTGHKQHAAQTQKHQNLANRGPLNIPRKHGAGKQGNDNKMVNESNKLNRRKFSA